MKTHVSDNNYAKLRTCQKCVTHLPVSADPKEWRKHTSFCCYSCAALAKIEGKLPSALRMCYIHETYSVTDTCPACQTSKPAKGKAKGVKA